MRAVPLLGGIVHHESLRKDSVLQRALLLQQVTIVLRVAGPDGVTGQATHRARAPQRSAEGGSSGEAGSLHRGQLLYHVISLFSYMLNGNPGGCVQ